MGERDLIRRVERLDPERTRVGDLMNCELAFKTEELHHMRAYIHGSA